jgi:hypothetical protein
LGIELIYSELVAEAELEEDELLIVDGKPLQL